MVTAGFNSLYSGISIEVWVVYHPKRHVSCVMIKAGAVPSYG
jgi:hypothetical protein